jgi:hypothetical protein
VAGTVLLQNGNTKIANNFLFTEDSWPYAYSYQGSECTVYTNYYEINGTQLLKKKFEASSTTSVVPVQGPKPVPVNPVDSYCSGYARVVKKDAPDLYIYESAKNAARIIPYEEASKLTLTPGIISPDGYTVMGDYQSAGIFDMFGGNDGYGIYAIKGRSQVRLSIPENDSYNRGQFAFLAWVENK